MLSITCQGSETPVWKPVRSYSKSFHSRESCRELHCFSPAQGASAVLPDFSTQVCIVLTELIYTSYSECSDIFSLVHFVLSAWMKARTTGAWLLGSCTSFHSPSQNLAKCVHSTGRLIDTADCQHNYVTVQKQCHWISCMELYMQAFSPNGRILVHKTCSTKDSKLKV